MATFKSIASAILPPRRPPRRPIPEGVTESERWLLTNMRKLDDQALVDMLLAMRPRARREAKS